MITNEHDKDEGHERGKHARYDNTLISSRWGRPELLHLQLELCKPWRPAFSDLELNELVSLLAFDSKRTRHAEVKQGVRRPGGGVRGDGGRCGLE